MGQKDNTFKIKIIFGFADSFLIKILVWLDNNGKMDEALSKIFKNVLEILKVGKRLKNTKNTAILCPSQIVYT